jgi:lipopolysaccharide export system permease protein
LKILSRYILKEHLGPLVFALSALTSLLLLNYIAKQFGELVGKGLPIRAILTFFGLSVPFTFAMTLPMAVLVAVLYAFSRLAAENEITALKASGVGMRHLMTPVLLGGLALSIGMLLFNDQVLPRANHQLALLQRDISRTRPTFALKEQVLNAVQDSRGPGARLYLRAGRIDGGSSKMHEVVLYDLSNPLRRRTIFADSGFITFSENRVDLHITLHSGVMHEVPTDDQAQLTRLYFDRERIRIPGVGSQFDRSDITHGKGDREMTICEMQAAFEMAGRRHHETRLIYEEVSRGEPRMLIPVILRDPGDSVPPAGEDTATVATSPRRTPVTLGGAYCALTRLLTATMRPKEAQAQQPPSPEASPTQRQRRRLADPDVHATGADTLFPRMSPEAPLPGMVVDTPDSAAAAAIGALDTARPAGEIVSFDEQQLKDAEQQMEYARRDMNRYLVEIHKKFALATTCVIFVLIGAPIALRFPRGGVGLVIGVSLSFFGLYYVGLIGGEALADRNIVAPFWGMWATNVIMAVIGIVLTARMGRETGTTRGGDFTDLVMTLRGSFARAARRVGIPLERRAT